MIQTTTNYTMTVQDMAAFQALLKLQGDVGPGMPSPGQTQFWDFFGVINDMAYDHYRLATNTQLKSWMDAVFNVLIQTQTCYKISGAGLYVLYMYYKINADSKTQTLNHITGYPIGWQSGGGTPGDWNKLLPNASPWNWLCGGGFGIWCIPAQPAAFTSAINQNGDILNDALIAAQGSTITVALETPGPQHTFDQIQQFEQSRFDPANWTDSNIFVQNLQKTTIWQDQSGAVRSLLKELALAADAYFYLLHLLIGLGTSNLTDQQLAQKITSTPVNSMEYPNDTFINQLMYVTLMYFADPLGDFGYDNAQLQGVLNDISSVIVSTDPASAAIKQSLVKSLKILHSDSSYPMTDPYNPNTGFNTRQSDTLAALDSARSSLT